MLGVTLQWTSIHQGGVEILLVSSWHRNQDKIDHLVPLQTLPTYIGELLPFFNIHAFCVEYSIFGLFVDGT